MKLNFMVTALNTISTHWKRLLIKVRDLIDPEDEWLVADEPYSRSFHKEKNGKNIKAKKIRVRRTIRRQSTKRTK